MTSDIPELKEGQVWKVGNGQYRRIEHIYYFQDGKPMDIKYIGNAGERLVFYNSWRAWARKTGARP